MSFIVSLFQHIDGIHSKGDSSPADFWCVCMHVATDLWSKLVEEHGLGLLVGSCRNRQSGTQ